MQVKASLRHLHIAPRKVRLVANLVKGMDAQAALRELQHLPKRSSEPLFKLIKSALANARNNFQLGDQAFIIKEMRVDGGPVYKRTMPRAFGKAAMIRKRTSHISLVLETKEAVEMTKDNRRKNTPVERDADMQDFKNDSGSKEKGKTQMGEKVKKTTNKGFTKKIFSRKTI